MQATKMYTLKLLKSFPHLLVFKHLKTHQDKLYYQPISEGTKIFKTCTVQISCQTLYTKNKRKSLACVLKLLILFSLIKNCYINSFERSLEKIAKSLKTFTTFSIFSLNWMHYISLSLVYVQKQDGAKRHKQNMKLIHAQLKWS